MPFKSKAQERAAFGGYLGPEMKARASTWAAETPNQRSLPEHAGHEQDAARALLSKGRKHERGESAKKERAEEAATRGMR